MSTNRTTRTRKLTRPVVGYSTELWGVRAGLGAPEQVWEPPDSNLSCTEVIERLAPDVTSAKLRMVAANRFYAWQWRNMIGVYDNVRVTSNQAAAADRTCVFTGFLVDHDMHFSGSRDEVIVTAMSNAHRLKSDTCVYGRQMLYDAADSTAWTQLIHATGLKCSFNAGGLPNRSKYYTQQSQYRVGIAAGGTLTSVPVFTWDGDPDAEYWTLWQAIRYLQAFYNEAETWLTNYPMTVDLVKGPGPLVKVDCDGLDAWSAMAACCRQAGYDLYESYSDVNPAADGPPTTAISIVKWGAGTQRTVKHQDTDVDDNDDQVASALDLEKTNLFGATIAESTASCVASPIVAGGRETVEITVDLYQAWDPGRLNVTTSDVIKPGEESDNETDTYVKRYYTRGSEFGRYSDVGRLWDANSDKRYSGSPYNCLDGGDLGVAADLAIKTWPRMPLPPRPCLTRHGTSASGRASQEAVLQVSFDSGSTWRPLSGFRMLKDRLGVQLTAANLASIVKPTGDKTDPADTLIGCLIDSPATVKMRLTCSVASPLRRIVNPPRRATAGTPHETKRFFDRSAADAARRRSSSSIFESGDPSDFPADTADAGNKLSLIAAAIQDAAEGRTLEANLPIEWPDEDLGLTDVITRIDGIDYDLAATQGARRVYPRIVGRTLLLGPQHAMSISLDSTRKAGVV